VSELALTQIRQLLATPELPALGPQPRAEALSEAELHAKLTPPLQETKLSVTQKELVRSLLLLWHDQLDASHTISQGIENADGSFVHAIMHRREPDYWNAKYWWRRVGAHPAFPEIARRVKGTLEQRRAGDLAAMLLPGGKWDACAFVDACEAAAGVSEREALLQKIQQIETEVLLDFFLRS